MPFLRKNFLVGLKAWWVPCLSKSALACAFVVAACGSHAQRVCTLKASYAIGLNFQPVPQHVTVTYTVNNGLPETFECDAGKGENCAALSLAADYVGHFTLHILAEGYATQSLDVDVPSDGCHAVTQVVEVSLQSL